MDGRFENQTMVFNSTTRNLLSRTHVAAAGLLTRSSELLNQIHQLGKKRRNEASKS